MSVNHEWMESVFLAAKWYSIVKHKPRETRELGVSSNQTVSSVTQSCLTLCNPMDCSTPGLPVLHQFLEFTQTHVHRACDAIQPSHPLPSFFTSCPQSSPASVSFPMSQFFVSGGQSIGASALASVLPVNVQD